MSSQLPRGDRGGAERRNPDQRAGLSGTFGVLGGGRTAVGADGRSRPASRQPPAGQCRGAAALEITLNGPTLKFNTDVQAVVCGAPLAVTLDGVDQPLDCVLTIPAGTTLKLGAISGAGVRSYLCLSGGIQVPDYLGSKAPLPSASLAATADGRCAEATCCIWRRTPPPEAGINYPPR